MQVAMNTLALFAKFMNNLSIVCIARKKCANNGNNDCPNPISGSYESMCLYIIYHDGKAVCSELFSHKKL